MRAAVIFLDIDGVLVSGRCYQPADPDSPLVVPKAESWLELPSGRRVRRPEPLCVAALNLLTDASAAFLVVSSTWRIDWKLAELREAFRAWGVEAPVAGFTPRLPGRPRGEEIATWLNLSSDLTKVTFVILDDDSDMGELSSRLIQTSFQSGLTPTDAYRAFALLSQKPADNISSLSKSIADHPSTAPKSIAGDRPPDIPPAALSAEARARVLDFLEFVIGETDGSGHDYGLPHVADRARDLLAELNPTSAFSPSSEGTKPEVPPLSRPDCPLEVPWLWAYFSWRWRAWRGKKAR